MDRQPFDDIPRPDRRAETGRRGRKRRRPGTTEAHRVARRAWRVGTRHRLDRGMAWRARAASTDHRPLCRRPCRRRRCRRDPGAAGSHRGRRRAGQPGGAAPGRRPGRVRPGHRPAGRRSAASPHDERAGMRRDHGLWHGSLGQAAGFAGVGRARRRREFLRGGAGRRAFDRRFTGCGRRGHGRARAEAGNDPLELLRQLGGRETAAMCGAIVAASQPARAGVAGGLSGRRGGGGAARCRAGRYRPLPRGAGLSAQLGYTGDWLSGWALSRPCSISAWRWRMEQARRLRFL